MRNKRQMDVKCTFWRDGAADERLLLFLEVNFTQTIAHVDNMTACVPTQIKHLSVKSDKFDGRGENFLVRKTLMVFVNM
jgi:hypothetical protein